MRRLLPPLFGLLLLTRALGAQSTGSQLRELLPPGTFKGVVLGEWAPPRLQELSRRLQAAVQADPAWFRGHVAAASPGQPLPYDARLGLSPAEYQEFLLLSDSLVMKPAGQVSLIILSTPSGYRFGPETSVPSLRGIEVDTVANIVRSPYGLLPAASPIVPSDAQHATGPWGGPRWHLDAVDTATMTGAAATFAIGRLVRTGQTVIYYNGTRAEAGTITGRDNVFITSPAP